MSAFCVRGPRLDPWPGMLFFLQILICCNCSFYCYLEVVVGFTISLHIVCKSKPKQSTRMGFEPTLAEPNGLAVHRLNHSATSSCGVVLFALSICNYNTSLSKKMIIVKLVDSRLSPIYMIRRKVSVSLMEYTSLEPLYPWANVHSVHILLGKVNKKNKCCNNSIIHLT